MAKYREEILDYISHTHDHPTADEVFRLLKTKYSGVVLATVYNNLNQLDKEGRIRRISVSGFPDRFDRAERHDHLQCVRCGRLTDIKLNDLSDQIQSQVNDSVLSYDLMVKYICPDCRVSSDRKHS